MAQSLPTFPPFEIHSDPTSTSQRWVKYVKRFKNLILAMNITNDTRQRALFLHYAGEDVMDILETLTETGTDLDTAISKLNDHFSPKKNIDYETYIFRKAIQNHGETLDCFATRLRQLASTCEFADDAREIKNQIIHGCSSNRLRRRILREPSMALPDILSLARASEQSELQATNIETMQETKYPESVNAIKSNQSKYSTEKPKYRYQNKMAYKSHSKSHVKSHDTVKVKPTTTCYYCGYDYPHANNKQCPAKGQECKYCHKLNHFASVCRKKQNSHESVKQVSTLKQEPDSSSDDEYVFGLKVAVVRDRQIHNNKQPVVNIKLNDYPISAVLDTGSTVNIINETSLKALAPGISLEKQHLPAIYSYNTSKPLDILGKFSATVKAHNDNDSVKTTFFVTKGSCDTLLSYRTSVDLGLIHITQHVAMSNNLTTTTNIISKYSDRYVGIGKLNGIQAKLHVDESVPPVAQPHRRLPFHLRDRTATELNRLLELDIIERVDDVPTPWVSPIRVIEKPKDPSQIRICVDMRAPNKAIQRSRHITPTIDDIVSDLNGSTIFSKLDLNAGYHQIELATESRYLTTFSTSSGLFRYKRLNFGVCSASELFQNNIQMSLQGLDGVTNVSDDILIYGRTQLEHDIRLEKTLIRLREKNLTLNAAKCEYGKSEIEFFGYIFSASGVSPDPKKVDAIKSTSRPQNPSDVKSFLGMVQYCARFITDLATLSKPLRDLTRQNIEFEWTAVHEKAFNDIKCALTDDSVIGYYNPSQPVELVVDASPVGLGAILTQKDDISGTKIISYASRSLTPVEQRYSQCEREALALTWGILHNHLYLYGNSFTAVTDHKPLLPLFSNPTSKPPTRIERWMLKLQGYTFNLIYRPGTNNPADFMSRHPIASTQQPSQEEKLAEEHINFITQNSIPKAVTLDEIRNATKNDSILQKVIELTKSNRWKDVYKSNPSVDIDNVTRKQLQSYAAIHSELSVGFNDTIVLRNSQIVVPTSLQQRICNLAHSGHQGIVKTKKLLRQKVWFPSIDRLVETMINNCLPCQATTPDNSSHREPLKMTTLPKAPWDSVCADFLGPLPSGDYLLIVYDEYSRYPEVERVSSTSAKATLPVFDKIFATHGIPSVLKTDNGPPFNGTEFQQFMQYLGLHHRKITPYWPRANGDAERFIKTLEKALRIAEIEDKPWKQEMYKFLRSYRATPHTSTDKPPAELLFNRPFKTTLPEVVIRVVDSIVRDKDDKSKVQMKHYADSKSRVSPRTISIGDRVLLRKDKRQKLSPLYNPQPYKVVNVKGSMVTAENGQHSVTRNSSFFKLLKLSDMSQVNDERSNDSDDDMPDIIIPTVERETPPNDHPPPDRPYRNRRMPSRFRDFQI